MKTTQLDDTKDIRVTCKRKVRPAGVDSEDRTNERVLSYAFTFEGAAGAPSWVYELAVRPLVIQHQNAFRKAYKTTHAFLEAVNAINATVSIKVDASTLGTGGGKITAKEAMTLLQNGTSASTILPMLKKADKPMFIAAVDMLRAMASDE